MRRASLSAVVAGDAFAQDPATREQVSKASAAARMVVWGMTFPVSWEAINEEGHDSRVARCKFARFVTTPAESKNKNGPESRTF
jgi:hypothetical protein